MKHPIAFTSAVLVAFAVAALLAVRMAGDAGSPTLVSGVAAPDPASLDPAAPDPISAPGSSAPADRSSAGTARALPDPVATPASLAREPTASATAAPEQKSWGDVAVAVRPSDLGGVAAPVFAALRTARDRMDACFVEESTRLEKGPAPATDPNDPPRGPAVVVLGLQGAPGELTVVSSTLEYLGTSSRELVRCCERHLVGLRIPVDSALAEHRYRMKYLLQ